MVSIATCSGVAVLRCLDTSNQLCVLPTREADERDERGDQRGGTMTHVSMSAAAAGSSGHAAVDQPLTTYLARINSAESSL